MEILKNTCTTFEKLTSKPESYLSVQDNVAREFKDLTKRLYDFTKTEEKNIKTNALPELIVEDFDEEQIWQEIELQNEDRWNGFISDVSKILSQKDNLNIPIEFSNKQSDVLSHNTKSSESDIEDEPEKIQVQKKSFTKKKDRKTKSKKPPKSKSGSIVDDNFFKLNELEAFLDAQDKLEMRKSRKLVSKKSKNEESSEDNDDDESIDLFAEMDSDDETASDSENPKEIKYNDFFGNDSGSESENDDNDKEKEESYNDDNLDSEANEKNADDDLDLRDTKNKSKTYRKVRFNIEQPSSGDDDSSDGDENQVSQKDNSTNLSEYQHRQERLKKKINHLENNLFEDKPWPMKGEVTATNRPQNSLLEEVVDFDVTSRPAPVMTEETTMKLQDIIIQRIKDKAWDDVQRKIKPVEEVHEFKKQLVLDQDKSKLSLAQVYEQEYIKQREALDPDADDKPEEEPKEHKEIRSLMTSLFTKLDALCNYHYTPKVAVPEVKIISNMPAINMEEVAPVATSDATLLAPEEIKAKTKGHIIGKSEKTDTDKKRERRQKKTRQREKEKERQRKDKLLDKMRPGLGNKYSREKASRLLDKVTKDRNVEKMETIGDSKSIKSSTAFFTQLQDEVANSIKSQLKMSKSKNKHLKSAKKLKL